jgi:hypothetical protein
MRLAAAFARFQTQLQADGRSPHTVAQYARHMRRFGAWLEAEGLPDHLVKVTVDLGATAQPRERRASSFTVVAGE